MKPIHTFTDRLRTAMDLRGTRAIDLARDTGLSKARISQYTNGIYGYVWKRLSPYGNTCGV